MKKFLSFSTLLLTAVSLNAQQYFPFPVTDAKWTVVFKKQICETEPIVTTVYDYQLYGDTTIDGKTYRKLGFRIQGQEMTTELAGALREDNGMIYYYAFPLTSNNALGTMFGGREALLYNFNAVAGETVVHDALSGFSSVIQSVDSILIGGQYHKRLHTAGQDDWVAGVGSTLNGLVSYLTPIPTCGIHQTRAVCFTERDNLLYRNPAFLNCNAQTLGVDKIYKASSLKIFPNPATTQELHIGNVDPADGLQAKVTDCTGRVLLSQPLTQKENIIKLPRDAALYLVVLSNRSGQVMRVEKVIPY